MVISIWLWPIPIPWRSLRDTVQKPWRFVIKMRWHGGRKVNPHTRRQLSTNICSSARWFELSHLKNCPSMSGRIKVWRSLQVELFPIISMSLVPVGIMQAQMRAEKKNLRPVLFGVAHVLQLLGCPNFIQTSAESCGVLWGWIMLNRPGQVCCPAKWPNGWRDLFPKHKSLKPQP